MNKKLFVACFGDEHYNTVPLVLQLVWLQAITFVIHPDAAWIHTELFHHHVADSFGTELNIEELPDDMMKVHVYASESAMLHWAVQFADAVEVLSPASLRKQIAETLRNALEKYET